MMSFKQFVAMQEGLWLPDRAAVSGLSKINPFPTTNAHRKKLVPKKVKAPPPVSPFKATVRQVVPPHSIPKFRTWNP